MSNIQLIIPCDALIASLELQLSIAVKQENFERASELKKQIEDLKANPKDEVVECKLVKL